MNFKLFLFAFTVMMTVGFAQSNKVNPRKIARKYDKFTGIATYYREEAKYDLWGGGDSLTKWGCQELLISVNDNWKVSFALIIVTQEAKYLPAYVNRAIFITSTGKRIEITSFTRDKRSVGNNLYQGVSVAALTEEEFLSLYNCQDGKFYYIGGERGYGDLFWGDETLAHFKAVIDYYNSVKDKIPKK